MIKSCYVATRRAMLFLPLVFVCTSTIAQSKQAKYACTEPNPAQLCNAGNTCGSNGEPCNVEVQRTAYGASAKAGIQKAKDNALFCVNAGTTVNWKSNSKETGFIVDLGPTSPFDPSGAIIGGTNKDVAVVAKRAGCFKYSVGACKSGAIYGMCKDSSAEVIVVSK